MTFAPRGSDGGGRRRPAQTEAAPFGTGKRSRLAPPIGFQSGRAAILSLQRSIGNRSVARMIQRHRDGEGVTTELEVPIGGRGLTRTIVVQRAVDVFPKAKGGAPFSDPVTYLKGTADEDHAVVEDPGSQGITGAPDAAAIGRYADPGQRRGELTLFERKKKVWEDLSQGETVDATTRKDAENKAQLVGVLIGRLKNVTDRPSAALFLKQNTLSLSQVDLSPTKRHNKGSGGSKSWTFHRDTGLLKVNPSDMSSAPVATALNGPWNEGWVRGHDSIANMKHRFIEHIHVNKKKDDAIDIFKRPKKDGDTAEAWAAKGEALKPSGPDAGAVSDVIEAAGAEDLRVYDS